MDYALSYASVGEALKTALGLMYTAPERFSSVNGTIHGWTDTGLFADTQRAWMNQQRSLGSLIAPLGRSRSRHQPARTVARTQQFAIAKGSAKDLGQSWLEQGRSDAGQVIPGAGSLALAEMLQPLSLLSDAKFSVVGTHIVAGRRAIAVRAKPRRQWHENTDCRLWEGPDEHRLLVDMERGILLSATSMVGGRAFAGKEIRRISFDSPLPQSAERWEQVTEIVNLLYRAQDNFSTARATVRRRHYHHESRRRLVVTKPDHFRGEEIGNDGRIVAVSGYQGDAWWRFSCNRNLADTNALPADIPDSVQVWRDAQSPDPGDDVYYVRDGEYAITAEHALNPSFLLYALWLEPAGRTTCAGRPATRVTGTPNGNNGAFRRWEGADEYDLLVDAERGTLLRLGVRRDGEEFASHEVTEIEFDAPVPDDTFTFSPPPGATVNVYGPGSSIGS